MKKIAEFIVKRSRFIAIFFIALLVFSAFSSSWVKVENDITVYLSDDTETKKGVVLMSDEFITYATADIMIEGITLEQAQETADKLTQIDGVLMVTFDDTEAHYKNNNALFNIFFSGPAAQEGVRESFEAVQEAITDYRFYVSTEDFTSNSEILNREMKGVITVVVLALVFVLFVTTNTNLEILLLILTFAAAALINVGTNFLLGTVSYIANGVAIVMQLALSIDYAIILCSRYKEEHEKLPIKEAVSSALTLSIPEIAASSLTTIAGLLSMTFMDFKLGLDLGLAFMKAIIISLLTVFLFMPVLLLFFGKWMDKSKHRHFVPKISFAGRFAYFARFIIPPLFVAAAIFGYFSFNRVNYAYSDDLVESITKNEATIAAERINARFGENRMLPLMVPAGDYEKEKALIAELEQRDEVNSVLGLASIEAVGGYSLGDSVNYRDFMEFAEVDENTAKALFAYCAAENGEYNSVTESLEEYETPVINLFDAIYKVSDTGTVELPEDKVNAVKGLYSQLVMAKDQFQGKNYSRIILFIDLPEQGEETFAFLDYVHAVAETYYPEGEVYLTGMAVASREFNETFDKDARIVSTMSLVFVVIILLFTFKSVGMPVLLVLIIQGSIWLNFSIAVWKGEYVYFLWYLIVSAIQMGANIDYAIVISSRYQLLRREGVERKEAAIQSVNIAFPTVITSGLLMSVSGLVIGFRVSDVALAGMGMYIGIGTLITLVLVNFVLPAMLILGDKFIAATTVVLPETLLVPKRRPLWRKLIAGLTALAALSVLVLTPMSASKSVKKLKKDIRQNTEFVEMSRSLGAIADSLSFETEEDADTSMEFAEHLVTDIVASELLEEGMEEYLEGEATIEEYKAMLDAGEEEYRAGYEEYEKGMAEYLAGQAQVSAGQAQYDAGLAQYEDGKRQYAEGQAEYDAGLAQYEQAKQLITLGETLYNEAKPVFDIVSPLYNALNAAEARYNEELAGDANPLKLSVLQAEAIAARAAFNAAIGGYTVGGLLEQIASAEGMIADGKAQLADSEAQLAAGKAELDAAQGQLAAAEAQLASARAELDAGYAQLAAGKAKLDAGWAELEAARAELDAGAKQIKEGEDQLAEARKQLDEGQTTVDENRKKLQENLDTLNQISDDKEKLRSGIEILLGIDGISKVAGNSMSDKQICTVSEQYFENQLKLLSSEAGLLTALYIISVLAAIAAIVAFALYVARKKLQTAVYIAAASALAAFVSFILWRVSTRLAAEIVFWIIIILFLSAALLSEQLAKQKAAESK